jgi:hypothetical protein
MMIVVTTALPIAGCMPFSDPGMDSASREQIRRVFDQCGVRSRELHEKESDGETDTVWHFNGAEPGIEKKLSCVNQHLASQEVTMTSWGSIIPNEAETNAQTH